MKINITTQSCTLSDNGITDIADKTLANIVTENFRAARVMEQFGLDFCCKGKVALHQACENKKIDLNAIIHELNQIDNASDYRTPDFNSWTCSLLAEYIIQNHHNYIWGAAERITRHIQKTASRHGEVHPELIAIADAFNTVIEELKLHMVKEERMLFPYIKSLDEAVRNGAELPSVPFASIYSPIQQMHAEHETAGDLLAEISRLSNNYTPPEDACNTYRVSFAEMGEFEKDLHQHIHLENNILFPKALELENVVLSAGNQCSI